MEANGGSRGRPPVSELAAFAIIFVWVLTAVVGELRGDYHAFDVATPVMVILAGALFAHGLVKRNGK